MLLVNVQDVATKVQSSFPLPFRGDGVNHARDKTYKASGNEEKSCVNLVGKGIVDSASVGIFENDPVFTKTSLPLRSTLHGFIASLNLNAFTIYLCCKLSFIFNKLDFSILVPWIY